MLNLHPQHLQIIVSIFGEILPNGVQAFVFGSRVNGTARKYSDVDVCLKRDQDIPSEVILDLKEAFSLSDLPFRVDIVIYRNCTDAFKKIIDENNVQIWPN